MTVEESGSGWNSRTRQPAQNGWDDGVHRRDGQSMAVKRVDSHHTVTVLEFQGEETEISKSELSADGEILKVQHGPGDASPDQMKDVHYWDKE